MGKWIVTPREKQPFDYIDFRDDVEETYYITCSECKHQFSSASKTLDYKYCPYCGTEMEQI